jgi:hypothetical protein
LPQERQLCPRRTRPDEALKKGMEEKPKEFVEKGSNVYAKV